MSFENGTVYVKWKLLALGLYVSWLIKNINLLSFLKFPWLGLLYEEAGRRAKNPGEDSDITVEPFANGYGRGR